MRFFLRSRAIARTLLLCALTLAAGVLLLVHAAAR